MKSGVNSGTGAGRTRLLYAFEETAEELADNVASLGFDLKALVATKELLLDYVYLDRSERVSVPHREGWYLDLADHFRAARTHRVARESQRRSRHSLDPLPLLVC